MVFKKGSMHLADAGKIWLFWAGSPEIGNGAPQGDLLAD
jgi:hypothetical protein